MAKIIILGDTTPEQNKKPIEFVHFLTSTLKINQTNAKPIGWENIELICKKYSNEFDLIFAYDNDRNSGTLYLGHFNDGVVE